MLENKIGVGYRIDRGFKNSCKMGVFWQQFCRHVLIVGHEGEASEQSTGLKRLPNERRSIPVTQAASQVKVARL